MLETTAGRGFRAGHIPVLKCVVLPTRLIKLDFVAGLSIGGRNLTGIVQEMPTFAMVLISLQRL